MRLSFSLKTLGEVCSGFFFLFSFSMTTEMKDKLPPVKNGSVWAVAPAGVVPGGGVCSQSLCSRSGSEQKQALVRHSERRARLQLCNVSGANVANV